MLWLLLLDGTSCADRGVLALDEIHPPLLSALVSIGLFGALDRTVASLRLLPAAFRSQRMLAQGPWKISLPMFPRRCR